MISSTRWHEQALCRQVDQDLFFPEVGESNSAAKRVCRVCDVAAECLEYALANDIRHGIFGGLSGNQRRLLKRQREGTAS